MKKPLAEWLKYRFGMELGYVVQMLKRRSFAIKVNGIQTKNMSYPLQQGDKVQIGRNEYEVKWKETEQNDN